MLRESKQESSARNMAYCLSAFSHGFRVVDRLLERVAGVGIYRQGIIRLSSRERSTKIDHVNIEENKASRPASVLLVSVLVLVEALAVLAYAVNYAIHIPDEGTVNAGGRIFMLGLCLLLAGWQGSVAVNFFKGKAFTRAPIVVWQLFQLILSVSFLKSDIPFVTIGAIASLLVAGAIVVFLFAPRTTQFLGDRPQH